MQSSVKESIEPTKDITRAYNAEIVEEKVKEQVVEEKNDVEVVKEEIIEEAKEEGSVECIDR